MNSLLMTYIVLVSVLGGCFAVESTSKTVVVLDLYPNGIPEDMRYSIEISGDSIRSVNYYSNLLP